MQALLAYVAHEQAARILRQELVETEARERPE